MIWEAMAAAMAMKRRSTRRTDLCTAMRRHLCFLKITQLCYFFLALIRLYLILSIDTIGTLQVALLCVYKKKPNLLAFVQISPCR